MELGQGRDARFAPPEPRGRTILRSRLIAPLQQRFTTPVTVVVAPAGFGKTTLLAQAMAENRLAPRGVDCWLTCTPADVAMSSLLESLRRAVHARAPTGRGASTVDPVLEAMWHRSPQEMVLLLDDVHEVRPGSPGAEVLATLVASLPGNGHVVLSGREQPRIALSRLELEGRVLRLGEADLRFTDDELAEFGARSGVAGEQLARSGGWPALAELAARSTPGVEATYMWEEVLAGMEPDRLHDLALLAQLGAVDHDLASAALGHEVDLTSLTADLPLVATTPRGGRHIHALWRPLLAGTVSETEVVAARRRAGRHLAATGDVAGAVGLLAMAGAWDDVTDVAVDALGAARPPVPGDVVATWLGQLPPAMADKPFARLLDAVSGVQDDPLRAAERLEDAATAFRRDANPAGELACLAQLGLLAWWSEQYDRIVGVTLRLFELDGADDANLAPLVSLARALVSDLASDAEQTLVELDRIPPGSLNSSWRSLVDWLRSTSLNHVGRPGEALEAAERACALADPLHEPLIESARVQALWMLGRTDDARRLLGPLIERGDAVGLRHSTAVMAATFATLLAAAGMSDEACRYVERARSVAVASQVPLVDVHLAIASAAVLVASGDERAAATALAAYLARSPHVDHGLAAFPQRRTLALWYVLAPGTRQVWDGARLGPPFAAGRRLACTLVAVRADGHLPAKAPELPAPELVRAHLPLPWATELALAYVAAGRACGWTLLDALWPAAHAEVRRHAHDPAAPLTRPARTALTRLPVPPTGRLELHLLGPVELLRDGSPVDAPEWRRQRVRTLLAHLVLHRPVRREQLAVDLWPDLDASAQSRNLRVTLAYLVRALEPERAERDASFLVRPHGGSLVLHRGEWFDADIWRFDDLHRRAVDADRRGVPSEALDPMRQAVALWRGDPVELAAEGWALADVEERRVRMVELAARAGELLLARGQPDEARHSAELALRTDPWCDRAHQVIMGAHRAEGDTRALRDALERYRAAMADVGVAPTESVLGLRRAPAARPSSPHRGPGTTAGAGSGGPASDR